MFHLQSISRLTTRACIKFLMRQASTIHQPRMFEFFMEKNWTLSKLVEKYLRDVLLEMCTLSHHGGYRYGITTTNLIECYNNNIKDVRFLPIKAMVEYIFYRNVVMWNAK